MALGCQHCPSLTAPPSPICALSMAPPPPSFLSTSRAWPTSGRLVSVCEGEGGMGGGGGAG